MVTRGPEAASLLAEATPILLSDPDTKALGVAVTQAQIAELRIIMGRPEAAVPYTRKALAALREVVDDNHPAMHIAKGIAVRHLALAGQYDEAEKIYRECLTLARERNLTVPLIFVTFLRSFAEPLLEQDQPRAVALYRDTYEITKYVLLRDRQSQVDMAPDPGAYAFITWNYANVLEECDKYVEAEATCREGLELVPRDYRGGFETLRLTLYLGDALQAQGRFAEAEKLCRRGLELAESCQFPPRVEGDFWKSRGLYELARALQSQGKLEDSAKYCQNVKALGDETWAPRAEELLAEINGKPSSD
jgi:tetratricopeptide (TPR) repeat protein